MKRYQVILIAGVVIGSLAMASNMEFESEQKMEQKYCDDVRAEVMPDYKGIFKEVCESKEATNAAVE